MPTKAVEKKAVKDKETPPGPQAKRKIGEESPAGGSGTKKAKPAKSGGKKSLDTIDLLKGLLDGKPLTGNLANLTALANNAVYLGLLAQANVTEKEKIRVWEQGVAMLSSEQKKI